MRIWTGIEMEGEFKGISTLFVESSVLSLVLIYKILEILKEHEEIKNVYLGAGRIDITEISSKGSDFFMLSLSSRATVLLETSIYNLNIASTLKEKVNQIICRFDVPGVDLSLVSSFKIDNCSKVYCAPSTMTIKTDLQSLKNGLYATDKLIYSDET